MAFVSMALTVNAAIKRGQSDACISSAEREQARPEVKAEAEGIRCVLPEGIAYEPTEKEQDLIQRLADFPAVVRQAGADYSPSDIANYVYELVKAFNQFYHDYSILNAESPEAKTFRVVLAANVAKVVRLGMSLLGIEVPERM